MISRYKIITTVKELKQLISACKTTKYASFDFETSGKGIYESGFYPTILSVSFQVGSSIIIPLNHFESPLRDKEKGGNGKWLKFLKKFGQEVIEDTSITKIAWNWKFDNQIMSKYNIHSRGYVIDGMLAKYLLNEEKPNGLKEMVDRYLPEMSGYENYEGSKLAWDKKPLEGLAKYGGQDTDATLRLSLFFESKLIELGFYSLYRNLIMMASRVLQDAEEGGMKLDVEFNQQLKVKYEKLITEATDNLLQLPKVKRFYLSLLERRKEDLINRLNEEIRELKRKPDSNSSKVQRQITSRKEKKTRIRTGTPKTKEELAVFEPLNLGSQKQMVELLYTNKNGFKFPIIAYTKDKYNKPTDNPSTAEETILELRKYDKYGFIDKLLELRKLNTIYSTFIIGIAEKLGLDGRIHPKFNIHGTVTGRMSSNDPNFQNLPRVTTNPDIKRMMIPGEGKLFVMMDYSQAELRVLAHLAHEETMLEWFRTGKDIHLASACKKYKEDYDEIMRIYEDEQHPEYTKWKKRRKQAKTINFGIAYEQTAMKLSESLSDPDKGEIVSVEEAQKFLDEFFNDFPNIKKFIDKQHKYAIKHGFVKTMFGRKRRLPGVYSEVYREYLEALRFSSNAPVQGTASDFALFSSILMWEKIKTGELPYFHECTTVHDSLVFEVDVKHITPFLVYVMWSICKNPSTKEYFGFQINDVEMAVDFGIGRTYAEELPFVPGYDYSKMLLPTFNKDDYYKLHKENKDIAISEYPVKFKEYFDEYKYKDKRRKERQDNISLQRKEDKDRRLGRIGNK